MHLTPGHKLAILCVLIAIPTGIAVWSKMHAHGPPGPSLLDLDLDDDDDRPDALQRYARAQQQQEAIRAAQAASLPDAGTVTLLSLFADGRPGAPGDVFDGLALDLPWESDVVIDRRIAALHAGTGADVSIAPDEIVVTVTPGPGARSSALRDAATAAWGTADRDRWLDPADHVRAVITTTLDGASVRWRRAIDVAELFPPDAATRSALLPALGDTSQEPPPLGTPTFENSRGFAYKLPAIGWAEVAVGVEVLVTNDRVAAVVVHTGARSDVDLQVVRAALRARYGVPIETGGGAEQVDERWRTHDLAITSTLATGGLDVELRPAR